jgi:hypothetical protein
MRLGAKVPRQQVFLCKHCGAKNADDLGVFAKISAYGALKTLEKDETKKPKAN